MTPELMQWFGQMIDLYNIETNEPACELGSLVVNPDQAPVRSYFTGSYFGVDQKAGPGVDWVHPIVDTTDEWNDYFSTVICTEVLEHDLTFWKTLEVAYRILQAGGVFVLTTCGFGAARHDYPSDYYRFTPDALEKLLETTGFDVMEVGEIFQGNQTSWHSVTAVAQKW